MWLKDLLPKHVVGLRVMTYSYDSRILEKPKAEVRMSDYTANFLEYWENVTSPVSIYSFGALLLGI